jgi:oxygen-independent coproporphyrinogen III oxidase
MYGLYIHIPFCKSKCGYCDFVSLEKRSELIPSYLKALMREMGSYRGIDLGTIYLGGGTPSFLSEEQFKDIFSRIRDTYNCCRVSEITIEANPESITDEKLRTLRSLGVNRLSIGAQSFFDDDLKFLDRAHTAKGFACAFAKARRMGFANINIDLMYGIPNQSFPRWKQNLKKAADMRPEHISIYPLTVEHGTRFCNEGIIADHDLQADMYEFSMDFLKEEGYEHYEISNWSRPGFKCRHNLTYWQNQEYIGVGASAASYTKSNRFKNTESVEEYISLVQSGKSPVKEKEHIDKKKKLTEEIILNMRLINGVTLTTDINENFEPEINGLLQQELIKKIGNNISLSKKGLLLANQVFREFV